MSTHAANSLISDLAEMVKAVEELPQVQAALEHEQSLTRNQLECIARLEQEKAALAFELMTTQAKVKTAEASRDDAELRFLEIEDRFSKLASAVTGAHSLVAVANAVAEPQVAEVTQSKADPTTPDGSVTTFPSEQSQGESATPPMIGTTTNTPASEGVSVSTDPTNANASAPDISSGAAAEPSVVSTQVEWPQPSEAPPLPLQSSPVPIPSTTPEVAASANGSASPSADAGGEQARPYEGKAYSEATGQTYGAYISLNAWLKGGGTEDNYYR